MLGLPIGIFTSNLSSGIIAKQYGWRVTFFIACIPGLILAALALKIREPHRGGAEEHHVVGQQQEGHLIGEFSGYRRFGGSSFPARCTISTPTR